MILIVVLWAVSLMTLTVVAISALSHKSLTLAGAETDQLRSELALEAGVAAAQAMIMSRKPEERVFFDGIPETIDLGGGRLAEISIREANGLLDLNRADPALVELFVKKNADDARSGGILLNALSKLRPERKPEPGLQPNGSVAGNTRQVSGFQQPQGNAAQASASQNQEPQTDHADQEPPPFITAYGQLYGIGDVPDDLLDKLLPFITLYSSQNGKINPLAAPNEVLQSVPGLSARELAALETARQRKQWQTPEINAILGSFEKFLAVGEARSFAVSVKLVQGPGIIAGQHLSTSLIGDIAGKEAFQVMAWSW